MNLHSMCWLGFSIFSATNLYGQRPDEILLPFAVARRSFLHNVDVAVSAGKRMDLLKVALADVLDPVRLKCQRTSFWNWTAQPMPPISPIMRDEKEYVELGVLWAEHVRDRQVLRSPPLLIPVKKPKSK